MLRFTSSAKESQENGRGVLMDDRCTCHDVLVIKDLRRWFKEKWVDVSRKDKDGKHPPCGRSKANTSSKGYPKCRPSVKVSSKTPRTSGSMSEGEKRAATKRKRAKKQGVGGKPTIVKASSARRRGTRSETEKGQMLLRGDQENALRLHVRGQPMLR